MCGRFTFRTDAARVAQAFAVPEVPELPPRYNIAPTQPVAGVRRATTRPGRECVLLRWGLIPSWAHDLKIGNRLINARADSAAVKPAFRAAFRRRRCLVLADGFYEWHQRDRIKQPYLIRRGDGQPFAFAGLWECWHGPDDQTIESCTILTTDANDLVRFLHDRMPVILPPSDHERWLDPAVQQPDELLPLLQPCPVDEMTAYAVSTLVNNPRHDDPRCAAPLESDGYRSSQK